MEALNLYRRGMESSKDRVTLNSKYQGQVWYLDYKCRSKIIDLLFHVGYYESILNHKSFVRQYDLKESSLSVCQFSNQSDQIIIKVKNGSQLLFYICFEPSFSKEPWFVVKYDTDVDAFFAPNDLLIETINLFINTMIKNKAEIISEYGCHGENR